MDISEINPHIRYAGIHYTMISKLHYNICYDCRLFYLKNISGTLFVDGTKNSLPENTAIFFPPETKYRFIMNKSEHSRVLVIDFDLVKKFSYLTDSLGTADEDDFDRNKIIKYELPKEFSVPIISNESVLGDKFERCINNYLEKATLYRETSSSMLRLCLINLLRDNLLSNSNIPIVRTVKHYIQENYRNIELTNKNIASALNYHPYYLSMIMKKSTGMTLHQSLLNYRLETAKNYLATTDFDITQIAWKCGFSSASHFIKLFREKNGITPKKYRENNINLNL